MDTYPTSRQCKKCGETKELEAFDKHPKCKYGRTHRCRQCATSHAMEWAKDNPERQAAYYKDYYAENREASKAAAKEWRRNNRERANEQSKRWAKANPERWALIQAKARDVRRAKKAGTGSFSVTIAEIAQLRSSPCAACGTVGTIEIDHVVPIARGGRHSIGNLQPLCRPCNRSKSSSLMVEWRYRASA